MDIRDKNVFCTIVTASHLKYAEGLYQSIRKYVADATMHVFVSDTKKEALHVDEYPANFYVYTSEDLCTTEVAHRITAKFRDHDHDAFRWSMKPVFINFLLQQRFCAKVIYTDCDIFFFHDPTFLFDALDAGSVLLTPHWRSSDPYREFANFQILFTSGIYNAGFIGVSKAGVRAMDWWAGVCAHTCIKDPGRGFFVDQTHLNLLPVYFDQVEVVKHRGCNVANWNMLECERIVQEDGSVLINGKYPIVFIHFTGSTVRGILKGNDRNLLPYLLQYERALKKLGIASINEQRLAIQQESRPRGRFSFLSKIFPSY